MLRRCTTATATACTCTRGTPSAARAAVVCCRRSTPTGWTMHAQPSFHVQRRWYCTPSGRSAGNTFETWTGLVKAMTVADKETVSLQGKQYTAKECCLHALACDSSKAVAWTNLGAHLKPDESVSLGEQGEFRRKDCFLRALSCELDWAAAWASLSLELQGQERVKVGEKEYSKVDCLRRAAELDIHAVRPWTSLGYFLLEESNDNGTSSAAVFGKQYNAKECFVQAVACGLARAAGAPTETSDAAIREAPERKLAEAKKETSVAWSALGDLLGFDDTAVVGGQEYDARQCYLAAVESDATQSSLWVHLGLGLLGAEGATEVIHGKHYTAKECFVEALARDTGSAFAWGLLGETLSPEETVSVSGKLYSKLHCIVRATELDPSERGGWINLGCLLAGTDETVTVGGQVYTSQQCFIGALNVDPLFAGSWEGLGSTLPSATEQVEVNGQFYNKTQCLVKALEDPGHRIPPVWKKLADCLAEGENVTVGELGSIDKKYCLQQCGQQQPDQ